METVAVYWEPIIRTYGFDVRSGLTLATWTRGAPPALYESLAPGSQDTAVSLVMAVAGPRDGDALSLSMVVDGEPPALGEDSHRAELLHPVDVVHFHGPHFGDRYGIATAARAALAQGGVELLLMGCTGASVYLAVHGGDGARTVQSLRRAFTTPDSTPPPEGFAP